MYFNSQDSSGADVNSVALTVKDGKENQVVQLLGELARAEGTVVFDDEVAGNDFQVSLTTLQQSAPSS